MYKYIIVTPQDFDGHNAAIAAAVGAELWVPDIEATQLVHGVRYLHVPEQAWHLYPDALTEVPTPTTVWYAYVWTEGGSLQAAVQGPGWSMPEPAATAIANGLDVERIARQSPAELAMEGELRYGAGNDTVRGAVTGFVMAGWLPDPTKHWDIGMPGAWKTPVQVPAGQGVNWPHREILRHSDAAPVLEYLRSLAAL